MNRHGKAGQRHEQEAELATRNEAIHASRQHLKKLAKERNLSPKTVELLSARHDHRVRLIPDDLDDGLDAIHQSNNVRLELIAAERVTSNSDATIKAARELVRRALEEKLSERSAVASPAMVVELLKVLFLGQAHESFVVLFLDAQHRLISAEEMFRGTLTQTSVYPREIVKAALSRNAAGVILAHNHPSGLSEPSGADKHLTNMLQSALALVDVRVLDHLVVAGLASSSFAERGLL